MALKLQRLDADRRRRRLRVLAELAGAKVLRERVHTRRTKRERIQELIASRRRLAG
jgi:hypothetical protein